MKYLNFFRRLLIAHQSQSIDDLVGKLKRRKYPRIRLTQGQHIEFKARQLNESLVVNVVSFGGLGFQLKQTNYVPTYNEILHGDLVFKNKTVPAQIAIKNWSTHNMGGQFITPSEDLFTLIANQFSIELGALNIKRIKSRDHSLNDLGVPWWYRGSSQEELLIIEKNYAPTDFYMFFSNYFLRGNQLGKLSYSPTPEGLELSKIKEDLPLQLESPVPNEVILLALEFINHIKDLPSRQKEFLSRHLKIQ